MKKHRVVGILSTIKSCFRKNTQSTERKIFIGKKNFKEIDFYMKTNHWQCTKTSDEVTSNHGGQCTLLCCFIILQCFRMFIGFKKSDSDREWFYFLIKEMHKFFILSETEFLSNLITFWVRLSTKSNESLTKTSTHT